MKAIYLFWVIFLIIDLLLGFYIFDRGGTDAVIKSGLMGNLSVCIIFMTVGAYVPVLIWSLAERKNNY